MMRDGRARTLEDGWPCQRLRLAIGLILFFFFETFIGQKLGDVLPIVLLGIGIASLVSAMQALRAWKLNAQLTMIMQALDHRI